MSGNPVEDTIFNADELEQNRLRKKELFNTLASGEMILFIGAGCSIAAEYPPWPKLIKALHDLANTSATLETPPGGFGDPLQYVDAIKNHIRKHESDLEKYYAHLSREYGGRRSAHIHGLIAALPVRGFVTTNYDRCLETVLRKSSPDTNCISIDNSFSRDMVSKCLLSLSSVRFSEVQDVLPDVGPNDLPAVDCRPIIHIHGTYDRANEIVLSREDYERAYGLNRSPDGPDYLNSSKDWTLHRRILWALLATRRTLFVGFSLDDPYLGAMLSMVGKDLWHFDRDVHFAILPIADKESEKSKAKAQKLFQDWGIRTIFYEVSNNSHDGLTDILDEAIEFMRASGIDRIHPSSFSPPAANGQGSGHTPAPNMIVPDDKFFLWSNRMRRKFGRDGDGQ